MAIKNVNDHAGENELKIVTNTFTMPTLKANLTTRGMHFQSTTRKNDLVKLLKECVRSIYTDVENKS